MKELNVIVKKDFLDLETGIIRRVGDRLKLPVKRVKEIKRKDANFLEVLKDASQKTDANKKVEKK